MRKFVGFASVAVLAIALGACSTEPATPNTGLPTSITGENTNDNLNSNLNSNSSNLNSNLNSNSNSNSSNLNSNSNSNLNSNSNSNSSNLNSNLNSNSSNLNSNSNSNSSNLNSNSNSNSSNLNSNSNSNSNSNANSNSNSNLNSNSNSNSNANSNSNSNLNSNSNSNLNSNSNSNSNANSNSNSNSNANTNSGSTGTNTAAASDVIQQLVQNGDFTTLLTALRLTGLDQTLAQAGPVTIFAPTDQAFAQLSPLVLQQLLADPTKLQSILSYHVVNGNLTSAQLAQQSSLTTLEGQTINVSASNNQITLNNSAHVTGTFESSDSSVYVIDKVLIPSNVNLNQ